MLALMEREAISVVSRNQIFVLCSALLSYLKGKHILISNTIAILKHTLKKKINKRKQA